MLNDEVQLYLRRTGVRRRPKSAPNGGFGSKAGVANASDGSQTNTVAAALPPGHLIRRVIGVTAATARIALSIKVCASGKYDDADDCSGDLLTPKPGFITKTDTLRENGCQQDRGTDDNYDY